MELKVQSLGNPSWRSNGVSRVGPAQLRLSEVSQHRSGERFCSQRVLTVTSQESKGKTSGYFFR